MLVTRQFEIELRKDGSIHDDGEVTAMLAGLGGLTDVVVLAHGWNNDKAEATALYDALLGNVERVVEAGLAPELHGRAVGAIRLFWPSKKFADADLIPGGGAASQTVANDAALVRALDRLKDDPERLGGSGLDEDRSVQLDRALRLIPLLETSSSARREFVESIRTVLNPDDQHPEDGSAEFFATDPEDLFDRFRGPVPVATAVAPGGASSLGASAGVPLVGDLLGGVQAAARRIANFATYYQMKNRAGTVGRTGAALVIARMRRAHPALRVHLVGHSFGGRLVTALAATLPPGSAGVSLTLLQAAFSHNGLSEKFDGSNDGAFRTVLSERRVAGPVIITHTKNDQAVGVAYPLASRISRDVSSALGDENDPYGGLGRNGAQHTAEAVEGRLQELGRPYAFEPGKVYNLRADAFVKDHGGVTGPEVAYALVRGITSVGEG